MMATVIVMPATSQAGWFSDRQPAKQVASKVKATAGNIQTKVTDISKKLNEVHHQIAESRPLMNKVKNGNMLGTLKEIVEFMGDKQQEFQAFQNGGVYGFRRDFKGMLNGFSNLVAETPAIRNPNRFQKRLNKASNLVEKVPTAFLFIMSEAVGDQLMEIRDNVDRLGVELAKLPRLPNNRELLQNIQAYESELCKFVDNREVAVSVAMVKNGLKTTIWTLNTINSYLPNDLTVSVTAVAGGGFTAAIHPAKVPFKVPLTVVEAIQLSLDNNIALAEAVCKGVNDK